MNVLLMGAGASKSYASSPTGKKMPIASDFFSTYQSLEIYKNPWVIRGQLLYYLRERRGLDPESILSSDINIEDLHSEIESELYKTINKPNDPSRIVLMAAFSELSSIFACVINTIQSGPTSVAHKRIAARLTSRDCVITFNWDTLMERALEEETNWTVDAGYGFMPRMVFRDGWTCPAVDGVRDFPVIYKLHGSSNWITSYPIVKNGDIGFTHESATDSVWVFEHAAKSYDCFAGRYMDGYGRLAFGYYPPNLLDVSGISPPEGWCFIQARPRHPEMPEGGAGSDGLASIPLIIPPVHNKRYDLYGELFTGLWKSAEEALKNASRIIVIGYSFPSTDLKSHDLIRGAFMKRSSIPDVVIVDPNPERIIQIFKHSFGIPEDKLRVFKEYFDDDFDLRKLGL